MNLNSYPVGPPGVRVAGSRPDPEEVMSVHAAIETLSAEIETAGSLAREVEAAVVGSIEDYGPLTGGNGLNGAISTSVSALGWTTATRPTRSRGTPVRGTIPGSTLVRTGPASTTRQRPSRLPTGRTSECGARRRINGGARSARSKPLRRRR